MSEKHPGPLVVEGKLTDAERMKLESNYLRGTIAEDLNDGLTGGFKGDNFLLIRFHGMYQQDDRDIRAERAEQKLEPRHAMLLRCRLPGGVITTKQWQAIDKFAGENTIYGSIRLTNRQTFQFHGILKKNVKPVHQMLHSVGLDALATANDMNRNVLCTSNPYESELHAEAYEWAKKISEHLLPRTRAPGCIWFSRFYGRYGYPSRAGSSPPLPPRPAYAPAAGSRTRWRYGRRFSCYRAQWTGRRPPAG